MNDVRIDPQFDRALREVLLAQVRTSSKPRAQKRRWLLFAGALAGAGMLGGVGAAATGLFSLPGVPTTTVLSSPSTAVYSGTATADLGPTPAGATGIEVELTCLTAGKFTFPDGANISCSTADPGTHGAWSKYVVPLDPSTQGVTITTAPGNRWQIVGRYISQAPTDWKVNAKGETYGVEVPGRGAPDLLAVRATNGATGYVYSDQMKGTDPASPEEAAKNLPKPQREVAVYLSDGTTQVGVFMAPG
ncbi:peptidase M56 family protein [Paenarthrobacter sp. NPDC056912]|uniref:peptidase M56 family protein n=1 Tax=Paenarthrobacter sp. NPDC056912 TaxID=3345965 RepID=UPI003672D175